MTRGRQRARVATLRGRARWRACTAALLCCLGAAWSAVSVAAHAELLRTEPAARAVLPAAPSQVRLWFSEPVDPPPDGVVIIGPDGARADGRDSRSVPGEEGAVDVSLGAAAQGTYVVRWRAISADSHPISGEFQFSIGQPSEPVTTALPASTGSGRSEIPLQAFARWLHLLGLCLLIGPLGLLVLSAGLQTQRVLQQSLWRASAWGSLLLLGAMPASFVAQSAAVAGSMREGLQVAALFGLLETRWGRLWIARVVVVLAAAAVTHVAARRSTRGPATGFWLPTALLASAVLISVTTLNSHSAATAPVWLSLLVDWAHVAATAVWVGGLIGLMVSLLPAVRRLDTELRRPLLTALVPRFSVLAVVSFEVLVLTGLYHAWAHVSEPAALTSTAYGRTLLVKLLVIGAMMAPAAFNLLVIRRRLSADGLPLTSGDERRFGWAVGAEASLGVVVLAAVGVLTSLPPALTARAEAPTTPVTVAPEPAVTLAAPAGRYLVTLSLGPGRIGSNHLDVRVQDERGGAVADAPVKLRITPPADTQIPPWVVAPQASGDHRLATVALAPEGRWRIDVEVQSGSEPFPTASFPMSIPMRGAAELLAASVDRMNGLGSVDEDVEMLMDGVRSAGHTTRAAPLDFTWLDGASDATVLRRDMINDVECVVVAYVDARDGSRVQVWISTTTLLVVQRTTAAPGHVHTSRFSKFAWRALPPMTR